MPTRRAAAVVPTQVRLEVLEQRRLFAVITGFTQSQFASGLDSPTAMEFAPDGRLFVAEQDGAVRVVTPDGQLQPTPFATFDTTGAGERGVIGLTLDPQFATNHFVYVYFTVPADGVVAPHNRIVRLVANGDVAQAGNQATRFDLDPLSNATNHNGGAMHFGADGKLYVAVGENANGPQAQSLSTTHGKLLRLNADGSIPTDNPFYSSTTGNNRAIWALGLRNPFTFGVQPATGRIFIDDVGGSESEEINDGVAGANYGWPTIEGPRVNETAPANYHDPIFSYGRDVGIAITGGTFYNPPAGASAAFPSEYVGDYFHSDLGGGFVRRFDPSSGQDATFATGISSPVDLDVDAAGNLYVLSYREETVTRFAVSTVLPATPTITRQPADQAVRAGEPATFSAEASGGAPLTYQWQRDGQDIPGATSSSYTLSAAAESDSGATFRVVVTNSGGSVTSDAVTLVVSRPGAGLAATYYDNADFTGRSVTRIDPGIDFGGGGSPDPAIAPTTFSARWAGQLEAPTSESYTFNLTAQGGARLVLNGQPLIDALKAKKVNASASIELVAGQKYDLTVEYVERKGASGVTLQWRSASRALEVVPADALFPAVGTVLSRPLLPTADAYVQDGKRSTRSFGSARQLLVSASSRSADVAGATRESVLTFSVAELSDIGSATLTLTGKAKGRGDAAQIGVFAVDDATWQESTLTFDTRPTSSDTPLATFNLPRGGKPAAYQVDLTSFLLAAKAASKSSVSIALKSLTGGAIVNFASREAKTGGPELVVTSP